MPIGHMFKFTTENFLPLFSSCLLSESGVGEHGYSQSVALYKEHFVNVMLISEMCV